MSKNDMTWVGDKKATCLPCESSTADFAVRSSQNLVCEDKCDASEEKSSFSDTLKSNQTPEDLNNFWFEFGSEKNHQAPPFSGIRNNIRGRSGTRSRLSRARQSSVSPSPARTAKPKLAVLSKRPLEGQECIFPAHKRQNNSIVDTSQLETDFQRLHIDPSEANVKLNHDSVR